MRCSTRAAAQPSCSEAAHEEPGSERIVELRDYIETLRLACELLKLSPSHPKSLCLLRIETRGDKGLGHDPLTVGQFDPHCLPSPDQDGFRLEMSPHFPTMITDVIGQSLGQPGRTAQPHPPH